MAMKDEDGKFNTALLDYVRQGSVELMQSLLRNDNPELIDLEGKTLLHYAAESNNVSMTRHLIKNKQAIDIADNHGNSPLMLAVDRDSYDTAILLVQAGANIYLCSDDAASILSNKPNYEAENLDLHKYHGFVTIIIRQLKKDCGNDEQLLLKRLRDFDCTLFQVIALGDANVTRLMLRNGYPVNERQIKNDYAALHRAVYLADVDNVKVLLEFGAIVDAPGEDNNLPLYYLFEKPSDSREGEEEERVEIMKILIEHSALSSKAPGPWQTPVQYIFHKGGLRSLTALKQYDVDFNSYEALDGLITNDNDDVLEVLRGTSFDKHRLSNEQFCDEGLTPLFSTAVWRGSCKKIEFLLEHGANANEIDYTDDDRTPLFIAFTYLNDQDSPENLLGTVRLLLQYGADAQQVITNENQEQQSVFDVENATSIRQQALESVVAHLAMIESCGETITDVMRRKIDSQDTYERHFQLCKKQIEEMKNTTVNGSVTLFKLLTESHLKITGYARDPEFTAKFEDAMTNKQFLDPYYTISLHKRVEKAIHEAKLKEEAIVVMHKIFPCCFRNCTGIFGEILAFLTCDDLKNICKIYDLQESKSFSLNTSYV